MKLTIPTIRENPTTLLRRAGYQFQRNTDQGEMSFVRPFGRSGFPRFHIYCKLNDLDLEISIHLDHKKETYGKATGHHGDYDAEGPLAEEVTRLQQLLKKV